MQPAPPLQDEMFYRSEFVSISDSIHRLLQDCDSLSAVGAYSLAGWSWMTAGSSVSRLQQHQLQYEPSLSLSSSFASPIDVLRTSHQERGARLVSILESSLVSLFQFKLSTLSTSSPGSPTSPRSSYTGSESPEVFSGGRVSRVSSPMASSTRVSPTFFGEAANQWLLQPRPSTQTTSTVSFSVTSVERLHDLLDCAERIGALAHLLTTVLPSHLMTSLFSHILSGSAKLSAPSIGSDSLELSFAMQPFASPSPVTVANQVALFANYIKAKLAISYQDNTEQKTLRNIESAQTRVPNSPAAGGGASAIKRLALTSPRISRNAFSSRNNTRSEEVNSSAPSLSDPQRRLLTILQKSLALIGRSLWCGVPGEKGIGKLLSEMVIQSMPQSLDHLRGWLDNELHPLGLIEIELTKMNFLEDTDDALPFRSALAATPMIYATRAREAILRSARDSCNLPLPDESQGTRLIMSSLGEKGNASDFITVLATPANTKRFGTKLSSGNTSLTSNSHDSIDFHAAVTRLLPMQVSTATLQLTRLVRETNEASILAASAGYSTLSNNFVLAAREIVGIYLAVMSTRMLSPSKEPSISLQMDVFRRGALFHNDCLLMAHVLARLSLLQSGDNAAIVFSDLIPSLQIAARESFAIQTEMMKNALTEAVLSESDSAVSDDSEGPTAAIAMQAGNLKLIGTMLAEVLSRTNFIRLFGTLADLCIQNTCKASFEEIQRALLCLEPTSGARGERSNVNASLRISSNIRLLLDISSEILGLDSSNPPTLFIKSWDRAKALVLALSLSLMKVREKAFSGFFGKVTLRGGQPAMTKEEVATILTFRFSPALGQKGVQLELKSL